MNGNVCVSVGMWLSSSLYLSTLLSELVRRGVLLSWPGLHFHRHVRVCVSKALVAIS